MILRKLVRNLLFRTRLYDYYLSKVSLKEITNVLNDPWPGDPSLGDKIFQGNYDLAGKKIFSPKKSIWLIKEKNFYWQNEMHSFSWLRHLKAKSGSLARKHARYLILDWIRNYGKWEEKTWELDILSRRISSWITNLGFLLAEKDDEFSNRIRKSLLKQIKHLNILSNKNYFIYLDKEYGVEEGSIKKIQIIRGLLIGSISFDGEFRSFKKVMHLLEEEIRKNFNSEGVHISRSPFIQLCILADLVTIRDSFISANILVPEFILLLIKKTSHATRFFRNYKGTFAMLNGSKMGEKKIIDKILNAADGKARAKGPKSLFKSGFEKLQAENVCIFVDTSCSKENMISSAPHSIEIGIGKKRLLGSCGTFYGKNNTWKKLIKSSVANSSLTIENTNPFTKEDKGQKTASKRFKRNGSEIVEITHYGYFNRFSSVCVRTIELGNDGRNIAIQDVIHSESLKNFDIRIHMSPYVKVSLSIDKKSAIILLGDQGWHFIFEGLVKLSIEPSIFIDDIGNHLNTSQLIMSGETTNKKTEILWGIKRIS